jgi:hypothetical protein
MFLLVQIYALDKAPLSGAVVKLASINLRKFGSFSYWFDKPQSHTEGRLAVVLIITFSWGFQLGGHLQNSYINTTPSRVTCL